MDIATPQLAIGIIIGLIFGFISGLKTCKSYTKHYHTTNGNKITFKRTKPHA